MIGSQDIDITNKLQGIFKEAKTKQSLEFIASDKFYHFLLIKVQRVYAVKKTMNKSKTSLIFQIRKHYTLPKLFYNILLDAGVSKFKDKEQFASF